MDRIDKAQSLPPEWTSKGTDAVDADDYGADGAATETPSSGEVAEKEMGSSTGEPSEIADGNTVHRTTIYYRVRADE